MKKLLLLLSFVLLFAEGCKKDQTGLTRINTVDRDQELISKAREAFTNGNLETSVDTSNIRQRLIKTPEWDLSSVKSFSFGKAVVVPIKYSMKVLINSYFNSNTAQDLDDLSRLFIYRDVNGVLHTEVVTAFPDSLNYRNGKFSGYIKVESWGGDLLNEFRYSQDPSVKTQKLLFASSGGKTRTALITTCNTLYVYVYSANDPENGYYSTENMGCTSFFIPDDQLPVASANSGDYGNVPGGGGTISNPAKVVMVAVGKHPVANLAMFLRCFGNYKGATYSVSLCVDQPMVGERLSFSSFNDEGASGLFVGHAFLQFTQNVAGVISKTSIGFYPGGTVTPFSPSAKGSLNDDSRHVYDVSLSINMTGQQFMAVLTAYSGGTLPNYNLNTNNCATWALSALAKGGIVINTKQGKWPFGGGDDPGDLGEDIRNFSLTPGMSRNLAGGTAPANVTTCSTENMR